MAIEWFLFDSNPLIINQVIEFLVKSLNRSPPFSFKFMQITMQMRHQMESDPKDFW